MSKMAVIQTGGKQYLVKEGDIVSIEKLDAKEGGAISFEEVLMLDDGTSTKAGGGLKGAKVSAEIVAQGRAKKVTVIRYRQKSRYFKKRGHRQPFTKVKITGIS